MRIVCISDTHEQHRSIELPPGDMLIHAGDLTYKGEAHAVKDFLDWFSAQPHKHKIFIAGNHDFLFENLSPFPGKYGDLTYLEQQSTEIEGLLIFGSPITPRFGNWAFMEERGDDIKYFWDEIPRGTDILITHGPPAGILDVTAPRWGSLNAGCFDLKKAVDRVKPKLHVFGHIHSAYGKLEQDGTIFVNASTCNEEYDPLNPPIVIDL